MLLRSLFMATLLCLSFTSCTTVRSGKYVTSKDFQGYRSLQGGKDAMQDMDFQQLIYQLRAIIFDLEMRIAMLENGGPEPRGDDYAAPAKPAGPEVEEHFE